MERATAWMERHWRLLVLLTWLGFSVWMLVQRVVPIEAFALGDTDDNMRMAQVRAWLDGQGWFDLRQHKLSPPLGADIHWSRLVDLPIAGLILGLRPFLGGAEAERWAAGIAPLLPLLLLAFSLALTARRLIGGVAAVALALGTLMSAGSTMGMFAPLRIDHHGWQLAFLATVMAGLADPKRGRGGATVGIASGLSLVIGLEMLIYLALAAGATAAAWIADTRQAKRLAAYALSLAATAGAGFLLFASEANRAAVCDALSPVWLADALVGAALAFALARWSPSDWRRRAMAAAAAGVVLAGFHALAFPHCLSRLEGVSDEAYALWLSHVREARPVTRHGARIASLILALPVTGLIGYGLLAWLARKDGERLRATMSVAVPAVVALALLFWQTRAGPAAQLMAIPGSIALAWVLAPRLFAADNAIVRVLGTSLAVLVGVGAVVPLVVQYLPAKPKKAAEAKVGSANRQCASLTALKPVAQQPAGDVLTFVDLSPRLITVTHHRAIAGPYHRNDDAIVENQKAFRGTAENAHATVRRRGIDYVLICPMMSESTVYTKENPQGFYVQLSKGQVPGWLTPVPLPKDSPFQMWRVVG